MRSGAASTLSTWAATLAAGGVGAMRWPGRRRDMRRRRRRITVAAAPVARRLAMARFFHGGSACSGASTGAVVPLRPPGLTGVEVAGAGQLVGGTGVAGLVVDGVVGCVV